MDFSEKARTPVQKYAGLLIVVALHVLIIYALVSGLARKAAQVVAPELIANIIEPVKPPPPPVAKIVPPPRVPKVTAPPPPFVPPPEVKVSAPPQPSPIAAVTNTAPPTPELPRPAPPVQAPPAPPAPIAAPPVRVAGINDLNSCKPEYPRASLVAEETGVTRVEFVVGPGGELVDAKVKRSSGSRSLDRAAVSGLSRCKFNPGTQDGKPVQSTFSVDYVWRLDN